MTTHTIISAEPKVDNFGNIQKTSSGAIKYRVTTEDGEVHTGLGDITTLVGVPNAVVVERKTLPSGGTYTVVNKADKADKNPTTAEEFNKSLNAPVMADDYRQRLIVRQNALTNANAALSRLSTVTEIKPDTKEFLEQTYEQTVKLAEMFEAWVMRGLDD